MAGARSETTLRFDLPRGWSAVTEYAETDGLFRVDRQPRNGVSPSRRAGSAIGRARHPARDDCRHARSPSPARPATTFAAWTCWRCSTGRCRRWRTSCGELPERLLIVSRQCDRCGAAACRRPAVLVPARRSADDQRECDQRRAARNHARGASAFKCRRVSRLDRIEGLAEYYSLELLRRGDAITEQPLSARRTSHDQVDWAAEGGELCCVTSSAETTARAANVFRRLDNELQQSTVRGASLDAVVAELTASEQPIDLQRLADTVAAVAGGPVDALHARHLPGCPAIDWPAGD